MKSEKPDNPEHKNNEEEAFRLEDATPLCPKCLLPCGPALYYCPHCDSNEAINPLASYMPFVNIRFVYGFFGKLYRLMVYGEDRSVLLRICCCLMLIWCTPILLIVGLPLLAIEQIEQTRRRKIVCICFYVALIALLIIWLYFSVAPSRANITYALP